MENIRELLQVFVRRFGFLNISCMENCCGEEISLVQSHILYELKRRDKPSMQQVAEALGIDITTFSRQIKNLESKGLVRKSPDPEDRRVNLLSLTPEGARVEGEINHRMAGYIERIFAQLTDFEKETVVRSIKLLNGALLKTGTCCAMDSDFMP